MGSHGTILQAQNQWIGLVGKILTGKPLFFNGKIYMVSGSDFPVNQSIDKKIQNSVSSMIWEVP
jgi:hypothetical protein